MRAAAVCNDDGHGHDMRRDRRLPVIPIDARAQPTAYCLRLLGRRVGERHARRVGSALLGGFGVVGFVDHAIQDRP